MNLRTFLVAFSVLIFSKSNLAQTESKGIMLGLNGTSFVKNFLSFNDINTTGTSPFQFTFRKIFASQNAFRSGLGLALGNSNQKEGDDVTDLTSTLVNFSAGYEKRNQISKRWLIYGGVDAIFDYQSSVTKNTSTTQTTTSKFVAYDGGIAPVFGIQFNISDRLSLSTESQLKILYSKSKDSNSGFGSFQSTTVDKKSYGVSALLPGFVYVNVLF